MAALSQETQTLWSFVYYVMNNPYKDFGGMTEQDFIDMAVLFADANNMESDGTAVAGSGRIGPYLGDAAASNLYSLSYWPIKGGGHASVVASYGTKASVQTAYYPDQHKGS